MSFDEALERVLAELSLQIPGELVARLVEHYTLLSRWNRKINLTRIDNPEQAAQRHFGESLLLHKHLPVCGSLVDVGSGGGFPGVPLAICRPDTSVVLVESVGKKASFLREASRDLKNVEVFYGRLSELGGSVDWAVIRAVAADQLLPDLMQRTTRVAILGTTQPPEQHYRWSDPLPLPWGNRRRLWLSST